MIPSFSGAAEQDRRKRLGLSEATVCSYVSEISTALGYMNCGEFTITASKAGY